jgi:hypothetical protein
MNFNPHLVVFLGPRANAELVPKFLAALHASHIALAMSTSKLYPMQTFNIKIPIGPTSSLCS